MSTTEASAVEKSPMDARALLRQARCPECESKGFTKLNLQCSWCMEREAVMGCLLACEVKPFPPEPSLADGGSRSADEPRDVLLGKSLRQYAHDQRIAACGAWSDVAKVPFEIDNAKCDLAAAHEGRLKAVIDELADLSRPSPEPAEHPAMETLWETQRKYDELIYAVSNKYPGETRHQTALRYIKAAESAGCDAGSSTTKDGGV